MADSLTSIDATEIGERLRLAREASGITQAAAAAAINVARPTLVTVEQGQRRARIEELRQLAQLYGTSVNALLRREAVQVDLVPRFRKLADGDDPAVLEAATLLSDLVKAEVELENLLGVQRCRNYPPERPILPGDVRAQAAQDANDLRHWLGIGHGPISDMVTLLDMQLGARVFVRRLKGQISGAFAFDEAVGPCILLNANHPASRRANSGAHELGHFVSTRQKPEVFRDQHPENSREERYANAFASTFLMPTRAVMQKFKDVTAGADRLTRRHVIILAHAFGVSREAIVRRLEELGLTKRGTWDWFTKHGGISDEQARQVLGGAISEDRYKGEADQPVSLRLGMLAGEAWRRELLSEGQLARLLQLDRLRLREVLDGLDIDESEADEAPELLG
jgi:Zn-dependent peptidase ImmA (M78 family)/transcriptional regulator with XRE-family HTH domain